MCECVSECECECGAGQPRAGGAGRRASGERGKPQLRNPKPETLNTKASNPEHQSLVCRKFENTIASYITKASYIAKVSYIAKPWTPKPQACTQAEAVLEREGGGAMLHSVVILVCLIPEHLI